MAKNKSRTISQQDYRDNLAKQLRHLRKNWSGDLAKALLEKSRNTKEYIDAKEWTNKTTLQQVKSFLFSNPWNYFNSDQKMTLDVWCKELFEKAPNFSEDEISLLKDMFLKWEHHSDFRFTFNNLANQLFKKEIFEWFDNDFLKENALTLWYEPSKCKIIINILNERIPNDVIFWTDLLDHNIECINEYGEDESDKREWKIIQRNIEKNIIKTDGVEAYLEQFSSVDKINEDDEPRIKYFIYRIKDWYIPAKISWGALKNISKKMEGRFENLPIEMVSNPDELKEELEAKFKAWRKIELYESLFWDKIWDIIDKSLQVPKYVNKIVEKWWYIPNWRRLVNNYIDSLAEWQTVDKKFTGKVIWDNNNDILDIWSNPYKLKVVNAETLGSWFFPLWYYLYIKHNTTDVDTSKLIDKVLWYGDFSEFWDSERSRKQKDYSHYVGYIERKMELSKKYSYIPSDLRQKYAETDKPGRFTEFMQDVYATNDKTYLRDLFECCFGLNWYSKYNYERLTDEDKDVLIMKAIDNLVDSPESCSEFLEEISRRCDTPYSLMLVYLVTWSVPSNGVWVQRVPQSVYRFVCEDFISQWKDIPTHWEVVPDPMIKQEHLEKLSDLYHKDQAEKKRKYEQEEAIRLERERIAREQKEVTEYSLAHCEDWEVILDYTGEQKYILIVDPETKKLKFISENLPFHSNIKSKYCPNGLCLWWWRITMDADKTKMVLHWYSESYGWLSAYEMQCAIKLLKKNYPELTFVTW